MNTAELRKTYEPSRGVSHPANAVLALCDEVDRLRAELTALGGLRTATQLLYDDLATYAADFAQCDPAGYAKASRTKAALSAGAKALGL